MLTKLSMGTPGFYTKKANSACTTTGILREDEEMCDSVVTVDYHIKDDLFLKLLNGRYYYDGQGYLRCLDYKKDKHLIGKIVRFRSPATCASDDGQSICKYCYGNLYDINKGMFSVGALAATKITEPAGQSILSSKHSMTTSSDEILFGPEFEKIFDINASEITLKEESEFDGSFSVVLNNVEIEESDDREFYYVNEFDVVDDSNKLLFHVVEEHGGKLYLSEDILSAWKKLKDKSTPISLDDIDEESPLFTVEVGSKQVSNLIEILQKLTNTNDHMGARTVSEMCQIFAENLMSFGIKYDLVHLECMVRALVRKKSNVFEYPDWTRAGDHNDYQILTLNNALYKNPSALVSMSYGYLRRQLISAEFYAKTAPSHLDPLFVRRLSDYIDQ